MKPKQKEQDKKATCLPTQPGWQEMNRKQRREMIRKIQSEDLRLEVVHPDAAGIDIGNESHYAVVAVSTPMAGAGRRERCCGTSAGLFFSGGIVAHFATSYSKRLFAA
ncbi:MAG TPA: hypothetical protein VH117_10400, partial [Edaphobacter sp.]|nr:hypothetical protein [Edaphobacter sp.]